MSLRCLLQRWTDGADAWRESSLRKIRQNRPAHDTTPLWATQRAACASARQQGSAAAHRQRGSGAQRQRSPQPSPLCVASLSDSTLTHSARCLLVSPFCDSASSSSSLVISISSPSQLDASPSGRLLAYLEAFALVVWPRAHTAVLAPPRALALRLPNLDLRSTHTHRARRGAARQRERGHRRTKKSGCFARLPRAAGAHRGSRPQSQSRVSPLPSPAPPACRRSIGYSARRQRPEEGVGRRYQGRRGLLGREYKTGRAGFSGRRRRTAEAAAAPRSDRLRGGRRTLGRHSAAAAGRGHSTGRRSRGRDRARRIAAAGARRTCACE